MYWSAPRYLLCMKSSEQSNPEEPGMSVNSGHLLFPGKRCQVAGDQQVEIHGAVMENFFQLLIPKESAWHKMQQPFLTCHLGSFKTLEK